ncbi:MAG: hypothetical protein ACYC63_13175 [Armatimonadota bacterium]
MSDEPMQPSFWEGNDRAYLLNLPCLNLRARDLIGLVVLHGGGQPPQMTPELPEVYQQLIGHPDTLIALTSAFDCRGGPWQFPQEDSAYQRRMDLHVMQRLQLAPGDSRSFRELFRRMKIDLITLDGICLFETPTENWPNWPREALSAYTAGLDKPLPLPQTAEEMATAKRISAQGVMDAERLYLRPHHLMCIMCYYGGEQDKPLEIDNLWEPILRMRENPEIEITLVEGDCMVCPPCHAYDPRSGACITICGLRDRRKDLDTIRLLDLLPGTTMKARDLYRLYIERIPHATDVCYYTEAETTIPEWAPCGSSKSGRYEKGLARVAKDLGLETE